MVISIVKMDTGARGGAEWVALVDGRFATSARTRKALVVWARRSHPEATLDVGGAPKFVAQEGAA
jgi:hypothetical protein